MVNGAVDSGDFMSRQENKALIRDYFDRVQRGDSGVADLIAEDATWWVPPASPLGGLYEGKERILELFDHGAQLYDRESPFRVELQEVVAEGEWVCVQAVIEATTARGQAYRNHYHFAFRVREGQIVATREHMDTLYVQHMLFDSDSQPA